MGLVEEHGFQAAGAFSTGTFRVAVANSNGLFAHHERTLSNFLTVVMTDSSSGYAERMSLDAHDIDAEAIAREAIQKAADGRNPAAIEPGEYEVILEDYAVCDILDFLGYLSFGALAVQEARSFMAGKLGQKLMGDNVSIWDDALDPQGMPVPFDLEGTPKRPVDFIRDGIALGPCYDLTTALKEGRESTGHGVRPGHEAMGPMPGNMFLATGNATREEMIASTARGILVTRFWYTRVVHPLTVIITGMTRDGTFLIEDGEIKHSVRNLRFTQSYLEALNHVAMIGREAQNLRSGFSFNRVPAIKVSGWNFTGATEY